MSLVRVRSGAMKSRRTAGNCFGVMVFMSLPLLLISITGMVLPRRSAEVVLRLLLPPPHNTSDSFAPTRRDCSTRSSRGLPSLIAPDYTNGESHDIEVNQCF